MIMQVNDISKKDVGYSQSPSARSRVDIVSDSFSTSRKENIFDNGFLTAAFSNSDPAKNTIDTTLGIRDMIDPSHNGSALDQIADDMGTNWNVNIKTGDMMRSSQMALKDGNEVANQRDGGFQVVEEKLAVQEQAWKSVKEQAVDALRDAASGNLDSDITPEAAEKSIVAPEMNGLGKLDAAIFGAGSMATGLTGAAAYIANEVIADRKDLSAKEKESLKNEAHVLAQSSGPSDTRAGASARSFSGGGKNYEVDAGNLDKQAFDTVLTETLDQQQGRKELLGEYANLKAVEANHNQVADNIGNVGVAEKTSVASHDWVESLLNEATVYADAQPSVESWQVDLTGDDLRGFSAFTMNNEQVAMNNDAMPDAKSVATKLDLKLFDQREASANLVADAHAQLRV